MRVASDERGNSYLVMRKTKHSPMADQYRRLCKLIGDDPEDVLAGALMPYRTDNWRNSRDEPNIEISADFWRDTILNGRIEQVFCVGRVVEKTVVKLTNARLMVEMPSGWGTAAIRRYLTVGGVKVYGLPHLSRFKLLSRTSCLSQIADLIEFD